MQIVNSIGDATASIQRCTVAIGNFDGVHRGHQAVINEAGMVAKAQGTPWTVLTLEPHPRHFFAPGQPPFRLTPAASKARFIAELGVNALIVLAFDEALAHLSAEKFVSDILVKGLAAHHVVSGYDFVFGRGRLGNTEMLLRMGRESGYDFTCVQAVSDGDGAVYSSTRARDALRRGDPKGAADILGRPFEIEATVIKGDQRGRTIGYPTANMALGEYIRPGNGGYAVLVGIDGARPEMAAVANIGNRPTVDGGEVNLEVHLFDFDGDLYGRQLRVQLIDFIRPEQKFDSLDALRQRIDIDAETARALLGRRVRENTLA